MFVLMISRSSLKLGHLISETRSPGQIKGKPCWCSRGHIFDDFKVMYIFLSSDLSFFHLGQFLSNYWSYRVILGTCEVFVFRSAFSVTIAPTTSDAGLGGSVGCAVRLETRRSRVQPPPRSATFFRGDWSWNIFYGHSLPSADSRRAVVSFWRKNVHNTG